MDAIGGARFDDGQGGDNEVQRTMLEIVNQLDGFDSRGNIKVRDLRAAELGSSADAGVQLARSSVGALSSVKIIIASVLRGKTDLKCCVISHVFCCDDAMFRAMVLSYKRAHVSRC